MMQSKRDDCNTLHVCVGASIESTYYKGEMKESEVDWKCKDTTVKQKTEMVACDYL
jgi:hypothetical protein